MKESSDADRDPLLALQGGDVTLFESFVRSESGRFLAFFRRLGARPSEAEDLVQDLFLKMFRHAHTYQPAGKFEAYAFRIAKNTWIDHQRRRAVRPFWRSGQAEDDDRAPELCVRSDSPSPGEAAERKEAARTVMDALATLSEGQRLVFELGVLQELPYAEISALLEIPEGTVKSRMHHALRKLRAAIEGLSPEDSEEFRA
ncbi:MAG: RNA polymerase sigma factor [bacterium]